MTAPAARTSRTEAVLGLTSDTDRLAEARELVTALAGRLGFDEGQASQIALAVDEALGNVIRHGYGGRRGQPIALFLERISQAGRTGLQVTIRDQGRQVDPATIVGRELSDVRPGGLGTHIIRGVMDEVEYDRGERSGMTLRLLKWVGAAEGARGSG